MSTPDKVRGFSLIVNERDDQGNPIENEDGTWASEFKNGGSTKELQEHDSVLFDGERAFYEYAHKIDDALQVRGLHLASPDAGESYRKTASGKIRMWVAQYDGAYGNGIVIE
jgi:hypothetical protein